MKGPISSGTRIQVFNNKNASTTKPGDSSWAEIRLLQNLPQYQHLIVGSFEGFQTNPLFRVRTWCNMRSDGRRNCPYSGTYLDGKVSFIRIIPPRLDSEVEIDASDDNDAVPDVLDESSPNETPKETEGLAEEEGPVGDSE